MHSGLRSAFLTSAVALLCATAAGAADNGAARSEASDTPRSGVVRSPLPPSESDGLPVAMVFYDLRGNSGITGGDSVARKKIEQALGLKAGVAFNEQQTQVAVSKVEALPFVKSAAYSLYESDRAGYVVLAIEVELGSKDRAPGPKGMLSGNASDFPTLYQDENTLIRFEISGGTGFYTDFNPWLGNAAAFTGRSPIALDPADGDSASWYEMSLKYGLSGIRRIPQTDFWLYGAGTFLTSFSTGQDLFRSDTREMTRLEELYAGVVWGAPESDWSGNISVGRQNWQLNDGFLFSRFAAGANAGPYPGLYLNPRTAYEMTVLGSLKWRDWKLEAFYVDPAEIDFLDSDSTYAGANLSWTLPGIMEASLLYYEAPSSNTVFPLPGGGSVGHEGMQTFDVRAGSSNFGGVKGLELFGEYAWQTHRDVSWDASAWYLRAGYTFASLPWKPNLSYRYASYSGDDPNTSTYERFDAQLSSGLDTWVQGVNAKKVVSNSNLNSHRIRLNVAPSEKLTLTFDYFWLLADEGSGSDEYAQELDLGVRWMISRNLYFLGVAGIAWPGDRLREQAGSDLNNWTTVQASLFLNF